MAKKNESTLEGWSEIIQKQGEQTRSRRDGRTSRCIWIVLPPAFTPSNPPEELRSFTTAAGAIDHLIVSTSDTNISPDDREIIIQNLIDGHAFDEHDSGWTIVRSELDG